MERTESKEAKHIDELFYTSFNDKIKNFSNLLKVRMTSIGKYETSDDGHVINYITKCLSNILNSKYKNLIQILRNSLTKVSNSIKQVKSSDLYEELYVLLKLLSDFNRYCLNMSLQYDTCGERRKSDCEIGLENLNDVSFTEKDTIRCRICEQLVDKNVFSEHLLLCYEAVANKESLNKVDMGIRKLQNECLKNLDICWYEAKESGMSFELPLLHIVFQLDSLFDIDLSVERLKEISKLVIATLKQISNIPKVRENIVIKNIVTSALDLVDKKKKQFIQVINVLSQASSTVISASSSFANAPLVASIADFDFLNQISFGKFARVYLARKRSTQDIYAIKVISRKSIADKNLLKHTLFEVDVLSNFKSNYVIKIYYSMCAKNNCYIVMEYLPGGDLKSLLNNTGNVDELTAKFYISEIVEALSYLRTKCIIHRDLKPDNILISKSGHLKLADFGLSEKAIETRSNDESSSIFGGTPGYAAPEVIMGGANLFASDYWSLGIILFELLCGEPPFNGKNEKETFMNTISKNIPMERLGDEISDSCKDLIMRLLEKDSEKRIGLHDINEIKNHKWFAGVEWDNLRKNEAPFEPELDNDADMSFFEDKGTIREDFVLDNEKEADILEDIQCAREQNASRGSLGSLCSIFSGEYDYSEEDVLSGFQSTNIYALGSISEECH